MEIENCNVLSIEWPSGSSYIVVDYFHVVYHVPVVGQEIALLLRLLQTRKGLDFSLVHLIGHSLGAHISGFVVLTHTLPLCNSL